MTVVVCGGGLAGLAAATVLAEQGVPVTLVERERYLGGRLGAWDDQLVDGTRFQMERGFHAFFRQYANVRALLRRVDPDLRRLVPLEDYPILGPRGAESFAGLPKTAPFNVVELVRRTRSLGLRDLARVDALRATAMLCYGEHTYARWDALSARDYLDSLRFPPDARRALFDVFAHSFFNPEEDFSAAELLMQFHFYFLGNRDGLLFDVLDRPFGRALLEPLRAYLEARGVRFRLGEAVSRVALASGGAQVAIDGSAPLDADAVVLALDVSALRRVVAASPALAPSLRASVETLDVTRPFVVWRLWLDLPARADRAPFAGTAAAGRRGPGSAGGLLDNISLFERLEDESRAWAARTGGSVVELHAYAVPSELSEDEVRRDLRAGLDALYPELAGARTIDERFLWRRDCPAFAPGSHALRPTVQTHHPELALAGDFVKLPFPSALMERAVSSGFLAANHLLRRDAQPVVPASSRGLLAALRL